MTQIERLRKAKPQPAWVPWLLLVCAIIWFLSMVLNKFADEPGLAAMNAACFAVLMLGYYATCQRNLNKEILDELDLLRRNARQDSGANTAQQSHGEATQESAPSAAP